MTNHVIEFRVWDAELKKFINDTNHAPAIRYDGTLFPYGTGHTSEYWPGRFSYYQFTTLLDGNNNRIFEGDILQINNKRGYIKLMDGEYRFVDTENFCYVIDWKQAKVIGNVLENYNLLK